MREENILCQDSFGNRTIQNSASKSSQEVKLKQLSPEHLLLSTQISSQMVCK